MAKKISLSLEIGGVKKSVSSIQELESAITEANSELKKLEIGSEAFNKLSGQIKQAKNASEDLQESLKGQDLEKRVGAYAKVGSAIVSSFAAANATIALFGEESEAVAQAAAKAQAVLTIALTAREIAEGAVALKTVAANIATVASAAAANTANTATKALYATLAANPYGAILAVIGLVVGAIVAFTGESEKQVDALKEVNAAVSEEAVNFNRQIILLQSLNTSNALRTKTIKDLNKEYPGFNAFLDENNRLTKDGIRFSELRTKQLIEEQKIKLLVNKIAEQSVKLLEIEQENIIDNITIWDELWAAIRGVGRVTPTSALTLALEDQRKRADEAKKVLDQLQGALNTVQVEYGKTLDQIGPYTQALERQEKIEERAAQNKKNNADRQRELNEAYKQGLNATINLSNAVKSLNESIQKYEKSIQRLSEINYEAPIIEQLKKVQEARKVAASSLVDDVTRVNQQIRELRPNLVVYDPLIQTFEFVRERLEKTFSQLDTKGIEKTLEGFQQVYEDFVKGNKTLTQEQRGYITEIIEGYKDFSKFLTDKDIFTGFIGSLKNVNVAWDNFRSNISEGKQDPLYAGAEALLQIIGDITAANKSFVLELKQSGQGLEGQAEKIQNAVNNIIKIDFDPIEVKKNAEFYIKKLEDDLFKPVALRLLQIELDTQKEALKIATDAKVKANLQGLIENITTQIEVVSKTGQFAASLSKTTGEEVRGQVNKLVETFLKLSTTLVTAEQKFFNVAAQIKKFESELKPEELGAAVAGIVTQNIEVISNTILGARTEQQKIEEQFIQKYKNSEEERVNFKNLLIQKGINVEKASYEELLKAYVEYKKKEADVTKKAETDKKQKFQNTLNEIGKGIQMFQGYLGEAASLVQARIQTDIESLRIAEKQNLALVVGDTESAAKKRLEIQAEYEARRKELEKKGRVSALQFSLVQAIANSAQGITRTIAELGFPLAIPFIAIQAGLTAAEIAIISDQISNAQALRRGGLVKAQRGMLLSGPSHENGGIPLAQMGVVAEGQEAIINRNSLVNFRDLLSTINQAGGGRPLVVNSFDDTRIVEAIASQKQKPLRAYVLQSEITNEQALAKRLDDLSKI